MLTFKKSKFKIKYVIIQKLNMLLYGGFFYEKK